MPPQTLEERFWARVEKTDDCWNWTGAKNSYGYGSIRESSCSDRRVPAHRVAYEQLVGPIPAGLTIDHLCRNRACVNPQHLEPATHRTNILRGVSFSAVNARKTECIHGHPFDKANTRVERNGKRRCRVCRSQQGREYRARNKDNHEKEATNE